MGNKKDNFWEMGDTGPCGPCTEIHVDCRPDEERKQVDGKTQVNKDNPQVIEIWNNVFIQFNRKKDGSLEPLPARHVDTGMGLERLVRVLQNKTSNYDTDIFTGTIAVAEGVTGKKYDYSDSKQAVAFRVIADHIRAISFTIADGQLPSNTGAGYVIRRILRRAVRYYYSYLDYKHPLLAQLVPVLAKQFETVFPELQKQVDFVAKVVKEEEEAFLRTLESGLKRFDNYFKEEGNPSISDIQVELDSLMGDRWDNSSSISKKEVSGKFAFELNDTYGFPIDLTQLIAREKGWTVDMEGFYIELQKQKNRSRAATSLDAGDWKSSIYSLGLQGDGGGPIIPRPKEQDDYLDRVILDTHFLRYRIVKQKNKEFAQIVLEETPFYAESGGQVGDTGELNFDGEIINVFDTKKENDLIIHYIDKLPSDEVLIGHSKVTAQINKARRKAITYHHSATHLLHAALRKVLGTHVAQKGSLVNDEHLRFDFSHFAKVTDEEIAKVEAIVNEKIRENIPVVIKSMPKDEAMKLGAMALFGEKYGDVVRVVIMDPDYSVELCGGTHVGATGELGLFKLTSESAVAAGVRRVEAICGTQAEEYVNSQLQLISSLKETLKNPKDILKAVENLQNENAELKKHLESLEARQLVGIRNELLAKDEIINGLTFIGDIVEVSNADALKKLCFDLKNHLQDYVAVLCANIGGKPFVAVGISDTVVTAKSLDAGKIIKEKVAPLIKGGGGGQKTLATAGGQDAGKLEEVITAVKNML
jgi:alanyl-tRNA synthetase